MSSLKEIKGRIQSVNNTLKITSAMKMVASSKLRKVQQASAHTLPYQRELHKMLVDLLQDVQASEGHGSDMYTKSRPVNKVALVCFSSNSALCGAFNLNVTRAALAKASEYISSGMQMSDIKVFAVGKKIYDAFRKAGYPDVQDWSKLSAKPSYDGAADLGELLVKGFIEGDFDRVEFIYNHYKSSASQPTFSEVYLPIDLASEAAQESDASDNRAGRSGSIDFIVEPDKDTQLAALLPKVLLLKVYTVLLDAAAAEHAARTVAMQIATDNGNGLLLSLTLEYNKGRQQKITNEILDLEGGLQEG